MIRVKDGYRRYGSEQGEESVRCIICILDLMTLPGTIGSTGKWLKLDNQSDKLS